MRVFLLAILATLTIGIFAFAPRTENKIAKQFKYSGPSDPAGYEIAENWQVGDNLSTCPGSGSTVCLLTPDDESIDTVSELIAELQANEFNNMNILDDRP